MTIGETVVGHSDRKMYDRFPLSSSLYTQAQDIVHNRPARTPCASESTCKDAGGPGGDRCHYASQRLVFIHKDHPLDRAAVGGKGADVDRVELEVIALRKFVLHVL